MSFKELVEKVEKSPEFKAFKKKHAQAFLFSAFFTSGMHLGNLVIETRQLDYFIGSNKAATFVVENNEIKQTESEMQKKQAPKEIDKEIKLDINDVMDIVKKQLKEKKLENYSISKTIAILQKIKIDEKQKQEKQVWNITCILEALKMLHVFIDMQGKVLKADVSSIFDMMRVGK